jgi:hypothetical protein
VVQFYSNMGAYLKTLKVTQAKLVGPITWDGTGLKLALGIGNNIFYANVK